MQHTPGGIRRVPGVPQSGGKRPGRAGLSCSCVPSHPRTPLRGLGEPEVGALQLGSPAQWDWSISGA